jgi:hypothetical protein
MFDSIKGLRGLLDRDDRLDPGEPLISVTHLRAAAAQLLLATGAAATLGRTPPPERDAAPGERYSRPIAWAPLVVATVAAAVQIRHARTPSAETARMLRLLNAAAVAVGGTLLAYDILDGSRRRAGNLGSLGFLSASMLTIALDRHEQAALAAERELRRRAEVVERFVPRRRPKLDRIVVHV